MSTLTSAMCGVQTYALVRSDLDTLLMPLLRQLYQATRRAPSHMYMLLVIVLILSQDAAFAAAVHKVCRRECSPARQIASTAGACAGIWRLVET